MIGGLPDQVLAGLQSVFAVRPEITSVVLYGSRAKGNYRPGSDIDLTIHANPSSYETLNACLQGIAQLNLPWRVDLSLYDHIDNQALREHIDRAGVEIWPKSI